MATITGGELLARCLAAEGVRFAFGLPCPELDPLLAAFEGNGIRLVPVGVKSISSDGRSAPPFSVLFTEAKRLAVSIWLSSAMTIQP